MAIGAISVGVRSRSKNARISSVEPIPGKGCDASNPTREQTTSSAGTPTSTATSTLSAVKKRRQRAGRQAGPLLSSFVESSHTPSLTPSLGAPNAPKRQTPHGRVIPRPP